MTKVTDRDAGPRDRTDPSRSFGRPWASACSPLRCPLCWRRVYPIVVHVAVIQHPLVDLMVRPLAWKIGGASYRSGANSTVPLAYQPARSAVYTGSIGLPL